MDKTAYVPKLREYGKVVFFARPRGFGKSLTSSTIDAYYSGKKELFQGLAAEKNTRAKEFVPKPVISIDMSEVAGSASMEILESALLGLVQRNAARHDVNVDEANAAISFRNLIEVICLKHAKTRAVVIIDGYDSPIAKLAEEVNLSPDQIESDDNIAHPSDNSQDKRLSPDKRPLSVIYDTPDESPETAKLLLAYLEREKIRLERKKMIFTQQARENAKRQLFEDTRDTIDYFLSQIKSSSKFIDLAFITGVARFHGMNFCPSLNNLLDITLHSEFARSLA